MKTTAWEGLLGLLAIIFKRIIVAFTHNKIKGASNFFCIKKELTKENKKST
jgi:hypothetical protein